MKPQKALHKYKADEKKTQQYRGHQYLMFPKLDGWYGFMDIGTGEGIKSNAGRVIPSCREGFNSVLLKEDDLVRGRLIFEITVEGVPQFEIMNGILNRKAVCKDIILNVHDFVPEGNLSMLTLDRYILARETVGALKLSFVKMINHIGSSRIPEEWESKARQLIDRGNEGLILKKLQAGYSPGKRNEDLLKIKEECEFDLLCVGFEAGAQDSKYRNTLGKLLLQDKVGNKFRVGGMSDHQRGSWWNSPNLIVHKVVKVKAKNIMKNGSLREPRFSVIRFDKNTDDIDIIRGKG